MSESENTSTAPVELLYLEGGMKLYKFDLKNEREKAWFSPTNEDGQTILEVKEKGIEGIKEMVQNVWLTLFFDFPGTKYAVSYLPVGAKRISQAKVAGDIDIGGKTSTVVIETVRDLVNKKLEEELAVIV